VKVPGHDTLRDPRIDGLEGFARSLTIAAPWFHREGGTHVSPEGESVDLLEFYRTGLRNGTNPQHPEFWGSAGDFDQRILEAADIAWSLFVARKHLWDPLSNDEKESLTAWLTGANGKSVKINNWVLAKVMINVVLRALDQPHSEEEIGDGLALVDEFYVGDGWYQDGLTEGYDYYNAWMFHDYLLKFTLIDGALGSKRNAYIRKRSARFLEDYRHFFAANGSQVSFGRSQTYRSAALGPVVMGAMAGGLGLEPGLARRLASGNLKFFLDGGMLAKRGNLTLGFTRPLLPLIEGYSCGGSPYLLGRAFSALLMPAEHPFWSATEEPLPVERGDYSLAVSVAGLILDGEKQGGHVQLVNHKSTSLVDGRQEKYGQFTYSSHFGYRVATEQSGHPPDSSLLVSRDGKSYSGRDKPFHLQASPGFGSSFFLPFGGDKTVVFTNTIFCDHFQLRIHQIVSTAPFSVIEGGYALGYDQGAPSAQSGPDWEFVGDGKRGSFIRRLVGFDHGRPASVPDGDGDAHLLAPHSATPGVGLRLGNHRQILLVSLVRGCLNGETPEDLASFVGKVESGHNWMTVTLANGDALFTQIGTVSEREVAVNGVRLSGRTVYARVFADGTIAAHYLDHSVS